MSLDIAIVHHLPEAGGAPRVLAEYVARRPGHRFTVYTRMPPAPPESRLVTLPREVVVHRLPLPAPHSAAGRMFRLARLPHYGRTLAAHIDAAGHDVVFAQASLLVQSHEVLPYLRTATLCYAPEPLRAVYEDPPAFGRSGGVRATLVRAGLDPYEALRKQLDRRHLRGADTVVTHSRFTADALLRIYGVVAEVVPLGVDTDAFRPAELARERSVLSVGALHPLKGHQDVIAAVATIQADRRPRVVIVGDRGELGPALAELARTLGVELEVLQGLPFAALVDEYRRAGAVAAAMIREPFGLTPLEAMACGAPVVAVAEGGLLETVCDGETGLLVERDPAALGTGLARVLDDPELAVRLGRSGRARVVEEWSWERTAVAFDKRLATLADRGPRDSRG